MKECGSCTLCCKLLETHDIPSEIGIYCQHCASDSGCTIHDERPEECRIYQCMWSQMEHTAEELRPDRCGIIFDRISDDVICARLEKGEKIRDLTFGQINSFRNEGFSIMVFRDKDYTYFLTKSHTNDYVKKVVNDSSKLY